MANNSLTFGVDLLPNSTTKEYNLGSSTNKWNIFGDLTGNASTATAANINSTENGIAYYSDASGTFASTGAGTDGYILIGKGANSAPEWQQTLPVSHGGTGLTTTTNVNAVVIGNSTTATSALQTVATASGAFYATSTNGKPTFGTLPVGQGGTNKTSWTQWGIVYASATTTLAQVTAGAAGNSTQPLISGGAAAPGWYGGLTLAGSAVASYIATFKGTTDSSAKTNGAVILDGGLGVAKQVTALKYSVDAKVTLQWNSTDQSLDFVFA